MTHAVYVFSGWVATAAVLAAYAAWVLARGRKLRQVSAQVGLGDANRAESSPPA